MKKFIPLLFSFLATTYLSAQYCEIIYDQQLLFETSKTVSAYTVLLDNRSSFYLEVSSQAESLQGNQMIKAGTDKPALIKDYSSGYIIHMAPVFTKMRTVKEPLPLQKWILSKEIKLIGGYPCKKATTSFRGRDYVAWYTDAIPVVGGPWKFDGLPGLILEVASTDGVLSIKTRTITIKNGTKPENYTLDEANAITWDAYCKEFQQAIERWRKHTAAKMDPGDEFQLSIDMIEDIGLKQRIVTVK